MSMYNICQLVINLCHIQQLNAACKSQCVNYVQPVQPAAVPSNGCCGPPNAPNRINTQTVMWVAQAGNGQQSNGFLSNFTSNSAQAPFPQQGGPFVGGAGGLNQQTTQRPYVSPASNYNPNVYGNTNNVNQQLGGQQPTTANYYQPMMPPNIQNYNNQPNSNTIQPPNYNQANTGFLGTQQYTSSQQTFTGGPNTYGNNQPNPNYQMNDQSTPMIQTGYTNVPNQNQPGYTNVPVQNQGSQSTQFQGTSNVPTQNTQGYTSQPQTNQQGVGPGGVYVSPYTQSPIQSSTQSISSTMGPTGNQQTITQNGSPSSTVFPYSTTNMYPGGFPTTQQPPISPNYQVQPGTPATNNQGQMSSTQFPNQEFGSSQGFNNQQGQFSSTQEPNQGISNQQGQFPTSQAPNQGFESTQGFNNQQGQFSSTQAPNQGFDNQQGQFSSTLSPSPDFNNQQGQFSSTQAPNQDFNNQQGEFSSTQAPNQDFNNQQGQFSSTQAPNQGSTQGFQNQPTQQTSGFSSTTGSPSNPVFIPGALSGSSTTPFPSSTTPGFQDENTQTFPTTGGMSSGQPSSTTAFPPDFNDQQFQNGQSGISTSPGSSTGPVQSASTTPDGQFSPGASTTGSQGPTTFGQNSDGNFVTPSMITQDGNQFGSTTQPIGGNGNFQSNDDPNGVMDTSTDMNTLYGRYNVTTQEPGSNPQFDAANNPASFSTNNGSLMMTVILALTAMMS